ncbi:MAG: hypothetical protein MUF51_04985 [Vicinamibacteria bacterium]|jgi:signal transduction histidine kinase|nr:hypothetical protein [Vicinamibacteria bacterium]
MDSILDKARSQHNILERIMNAIPGFSGYREKELRRDADRMQREYLAKRLEEIKANLNTLAAKASRSGNLDSINDIESARKKLDRVINRIRYAERGYTGFFDAIKVDDAALARVYEFDGALLDEVDLARSVGDAVQDLIPRLDALDARMNERETILKGIQ